MIAKKNILGVGITNATKKEILEYILKNIENFEKKLFFVTPNPEFLVLAHKNSDFKSILNKANLALMDGIGIAFAAKILGRPLKERFPGVDLVKSLCREIARKPITVGFLGGGEGVAEKTAECLLVRYPRLRVVFADSEWRDDWFGYKHSNSKLKTQNSKLQLKTQNLGLKTKDQRPKTIDILFVAFGAPKQEMWINENLENLPVKVAIGVGGAFDYISGRVRRAPTFIQNIGLEWLYRMVSQPWRIKRQIALLEFVFLVLREKLTSTKGI